MSRAEPLVNQARHHRRREDASSFRLTVTIVLIRTNHEYCRNDNSTDNNTSTLIARIIPITVIKTVNGNCNDNTHKSISAEELTGGREKGNIIPT